MRVHGAFLLVLVLVAAVILLLRTGEVKTGLEGVASITADLREANVAGAALDEAAAEKMIAAMDALLAEPEEIRHHVADLRDYAAIAASWADGAVSPSRELSVAVALRGAADDLRAYAVQAHAPRLEECRRALASARAGLEGDAAPQGAVSGLRDRLDNIQRAHEEKTQEINEELQH